MPVDFLSLFAAHRVVRALCACQHRAGKVTKAANLDALLTDLNADV